MRIDIRDSKYSILYNEKTGAVEDVLWCNESAEELKRAYGTNPRKIGADYYIDDKAMPPDLFVS